MTDNIRPPKADRSQLQQIIAGLTDGVILVDPDQTFAWANPKALALHGVTEIGQLGAIVVLRTVLNFSLQQEIDKAEAHTAAN